jgi:putative membrane protein
LIWVSVALPPTDVQPAFAKGKTPTSDLTHSQLRKRKADTLRLCLAFVFAAKHYLRGEDGVNYADYHGVLPSSFARFDEFGYNSPKKPPFGTYSATGNDALAASPEGSISQSGRNSPDIKPDATKRIKVKRSKQQILDHSTPLLQDAHRSVDFQPFAKETSLPLPLMYVRSLLSNAWALKDIL